MRAWLRVMTNEDLIKVTPHPKQVLLQRINEICHLKDLANSLRIEQRNLEVELTFIDLHFDNMAKLNIPLILDQPNVPVAINIWVVNSHSYFDNKTKVDLSK